MWSLFLSISIAIWPSKGCCQLPLCQQGRFTFYIFTSWSLYPAPSLPLSPPPSLPLSPPPSLPLGSDPGCNNSSCGGSPGLGESLFWRAVGQIQSLEGHKLLSFNSDWPLVDPRPLWNATLSHFWTLFHLVSLFGQGCCLPEACWSIVYQIPVKDHSNHHGWTGILACLETMHATESMLHVLGNLDQSHLCVS